MDIRVDRPRDADPALDARLWRTFIATSDGTAPTATEVDGFSGLQAEIHDSELSAVCLMAVSHGG
jgi:hypothetical protein